MSALGADVLDLLLPNAADDRRASARRVVTFLRLLRDSASPRRAVSVTVQLEGARVELERSTRERLLGAVSDLWSHCARSLRSADSFLWVDAPRLAHAAAWRLVEEERDEHPWLPGLREPGESVVQLMSRLEVGARRLGADVEDLARWRALRLALSEGPAAARVALVDLARNPGRGARRAACALVEGHLDAGAVSAARDLLRGARHAPARASAPVRGASQSQHAEGSGASADAGDDGLLEARWRRLRSWVELLSGSASGEDPCEPSVASEHPQSLEWQRLPRPLHELRRALPQWNSRLRGRVERASRRREGAVQGRGRAAVGAACSSLWVLEDGGAAREVWREAAPAWERSASAVGAAGLDANGLTDPHRRPDAPEHEALLRGRPVVRYAPAARHVSAGGGAPQATGTRRPQATAVAPVLGEHGRVLGWLRLDFEHLLAPAQARLQRLARGWRGTLERADREGPDRVRPIREGTGRQGDLRAALSVSQRQEGVAESVREVVFREWIARAGLRLGRRRWWGIDGPDLPARVVAEGGSGLVDWKTQPGGGGLLARALVCGGRAEFDGEQPELALAREARSGLVLALVEEGSVLGALALESERRRDAHAALAALAEHAPRAARELARARFAAWHESNFGSAPWFDDASAAVLALEDELTRAASASGLVVLCGPSGCGKRVMARRAHFGGRRLPGPWSEHDCGELDARAEEVALFGSPGDAAVGSLEAMGGGTLLLVEIERLGAPSQARLARWLARASPRDPVTTSGARVMATSRRPIALSARAGSLRADLAAHLERRALQVPSLSQRREDLPGLTQHLVSRFARELGRAGVVDEQALALIWRQPWEGNVRQLESVLYRAVALSGSKGIDVEVLREALRRLHLECLERVPSRPPQPEWLRAALQTARHVRGTWNRARAAAYLGWDPDTLARAMDACGIARDPDGEGDASASATCEAPLPDGLFP